MLVVRIELWSARTGARSELGVAVISNVGGTATRGNYSVELHRTFERAKQRRPPYRAATFKDFPRKSLGAFDLLLRALLWTMGDRNKKELELVRKSHASKGVDGPSSTSRDTG